MDNNHLRAIILKLQDRLSDDDRKRLHFFLGNDVPRRIRDDPSLGGTLCLMESLFDQDKINDQDFTFLINAFMQIRCLDAVKLLQEHMKQIKPNGNPHLEQSLSVVMPTLADQLLNDMEEDTIAVSNVVIDKRNDSVQYIAIDEQKNDFNSIRMNSNASTTIDSKTTTVSCSKPFISKKPFDLSTISKRYVLVFIILMIVLVMLVIGLIVGIVLVKGELHRKEVDCLQEQAKNNETIELYKKLQAQGNATVHTLSREKKSLKEQLRKLNLTIDSLPIEGPQNLNCYSPQKVLYATLLGTSIGTTCSCQKWCLENGSPYGVCGDGPTCICRKIPIIKEHVRNACACDEWCRKYGYSNGGVCGDRYTCLCAS